MGFKNGTNGGVKIAVDAIGAAKNSHSAKHVQETSEMVEKAGLNPKIMIDFSHANSFKTPERQAEVSDDVSKQIAAGDKRIFGVMIESHRCNLASASFSSSRSS